MLEDHNLRNGKTNISKEVNENVKVFVYVVLALLWIPLTFIAMLVNILGGDGQLAIEVKESYKNNAKKLKKHIKDNDWEYQKIDRRVENLIGEEAKLERQVTASYRDLKETENKIYRMQDLLAMGESLDPGMLDFQEKQKKRLMSHWNYLRNKVKELDEKKTKVFDGWNKLRPELALTKEDIGLEDFLRISL